MQRLDIEDQCLTAGHQCERVRRTDMPQEGSIQNVQNTRTMTNATMGALAIADEHITTRRGFEHVGNPARYQRWIDADETFSGMKMAGRYLEN